MTLSSTEVILLKELKETALLSARIEDKQIPRIYNAIHQLRKDGYVQWVVAPWWGYALLRITESGRNMLSEHEGSKL